MHCSSRVILFHACQIVTRVRAFRASTQVCESRMCWHSEVHYEICVFPIIERMIVCNGKRWLCYFMQAAPTLVIVLFSLNHNKQTRNVNVGQYAQWCRSMQAWATPSGVCHFPSTNRVYFKGMKRELLVDPIPAGIATSVSVIQV